MYIYSIPLYVPTERYEKTIRLFLLKGNSGSNNHYCVIKGDSMSRLISSQVSKKEHKKFVCDFCLCSFGSQDLLDRHTEYCSKHDAVNTIFPKPRENILKFKNIQNCIECPIKVYCDFESFLTHINKMHGKTRLYQKDTPSAFCLYVVSRVKGFSMDPIVYVKQGETDEVDKVFVETLNKFTKDLESPPQ